MRDDVNISSKSEVNSYERLEGSDLHDSWEIPLPRTEKRRPVVTTYSEPSQPLRGGTPRRSVSTSLSRKACRFLSTNVLFGDSNFNFTRLSSGRKNDNDTGNDLRPTGLTGFFFGFMYEEPFSESFDYDDDETISPSAWNPLNAKLFLSLTLTTASTAVPVILLPTLGQDLLDDSNEASAFASHAAASAVLGTACGKFLNGPVVDVFGARRTSVLYSVLLSVSLLGLSMCGSDTCAVWACFFVEFFQSVQWPCMIVILATHYGSSNYAMYEGGIYVTSIASRFGSLLGIPLFSILGRRAQWRVVCLLGAWMAMIGSSVSYLFMTDSPYNVNEPQNPLHPSLQKQIATLDFRSNPRQLILIYWNVLRSIFLNNLLPSLGHVLKSGIFWIVAIAHTGSSMVRTSERILGVYFRDTSMGALSEDRAGGWAVFLSLGTILGLVIAGKMFAGRKERQRKWLVSRLYIVTIAACYCLALLAIPRLQNLVADPGAILSFQVMASFVMGFGSAVMFYHIPGLVGAAFGSDKGLFSAYTDGVAYGLASIVWRIVGNAVESGDSEGGGWAYGWAAVALLIILCGVLMVEFMEHYFIRASGKHHGTHETIIFV